MKHPDILAPANNKEEVLPLIKAGANWVYGGCLPEEWSGKYPSIVPLNQRTFDSAQFSSFDDLAEAVSIAKANGGSFALTMNAPYYMETQMEHALDLAEKAAASGVGAIIVADPGLIMALKSRSIGIPIHMSTMALATNSSAVDLYRSMGAERIILPRFLSIAEIRDLCSLEPDIEFEAFIFIGKCPNIEGVCSFLHDSPDRRWPCEWEYFASGSHGGSAPDEVGDYLSVLSETDRRDACGLCAIPDLMDAGVHSFKVVGRGAPIARKTALVKALMETISMAHKEMPLDWIAYCKDKYGSVFGHGCTPMDCYYPEVLLNK